MMFQMHDRSMRILLCVTASFSLTGSLAAAPPSVGTGELRSLTAIPEKVILKGADHSQQLVITGHFANDGVRDLTSDATWRVADGQIVQVDAHGLLSVKKNGT